MQRAISPIILLLFLLFSILLIPACTESDDDTSGDGDMDGESVPGDADEEFDDDPPPADGDEDGDEEIADSENEAETDPDDSAEEWTPLASAPDASGDCEEQDENCRADIRDLSFRVEEGTLYWKIEYNAAPPEDHSFELFMIPPDSSLVGHTVRYNNGRFSYWNADCSTAAKHAGCHWSTENLPGSFRYTFNEGGDFHLEISLADLGFENLPKLLAGLAAAPFVIQKTAEFTDRHPDDLWVTSTEIQGLAEIPLSP